MIDLSSLGTATSTIQSLSNIILVTPQDNKGILAQTSNAKSFFFHYEGENHVMLESDITDHYAEDNTAIQDQIALKPELIGMAGFIAELNDVPPPALAPLKTAADRLALLNPFLPQVSITALIAYNEAAQAYAAVAAAASSVSTTISSLSTQAQSQNKQQQAYLYFRSAWKSRSLFTVQTPWEIFKNVAIKTCKAVEDESTNVVTGFEVTFKQMTFTSQAGGAITKPSLNGRLAAQGASEVNFGTSSGVDAGPMSDSISSKWAVG